MMALDQCEELDALTKKWEKDPAVVRYRVWADGARAYGRNDVLLYAFPSKGSTDMTTPRSEVYAAIDSEREYQEKRWRGSAPGADPRAHELDAWVAYIAAYSNRLLDKSASWDGTDNTEVLNFVRKVAALCVVTMEHHGAPHREDEARNV